MPVKWTPEYDRLLLLKLIETHGVSVNTQQIVDAWPKDDPFQPTPRAITERFVALRKQVGIKASISSNGTPGKKNPRSSKYTTPMTTPRKRKAKKEDMESDADEHFTEEETPTLKRKSAQRGFGHSRGKLGGGNGANGSSPNGVHVKTEVLDNSLTSPEFKRLSARAAELPAALDDPFGDYNVPSSYSGNGVTFPNIQGGTNGMDEQAFYGFTDNNCGLANMGMDFNADAFSGGLGMPMQDPLAAPTSQPQVLGHQGIKTSSRVVPKAAFAGAPRPSAAPSDGSASQEMRARSARKASRQASEEMSAWIRAEKEEDKVNGDKTSEEDSQGSEFHESDGDYV